MPYELLHNRCITNFFQILIQIFCFAELLSTVEPELQDLQAADVNAQTAANVLSKRTNALTARKGTNGTDSRSVTNIQVTAD